MAHLSLSLLGPFQATLDREPVTGFESNKVRALLAYLAVEADRPYPREVLAGLLWPDWPERSALSNLRYALSNLRKAIGDQQAQPPFLLITNDALRFNTASDFDLDVRAFNEHVETDYTRPLDIERLRQAVALHRGVFLEGFSVSGSTAFEEWVVLKREQLGRQMLKALSDLADYHEHRSEYEQAQQYARRLVELDPLQEEGHRQLMRVLALGGQRSAVLAQYETCRRQLAEELGVEPSADTTELYAHIRDERLKAHPFLSTPLAFTGSEAESTEVERPVFVAREPELARLNGFLNKALAGHGHVAFVTGEPGSGKTMLMQEFVRRSLATHGDLVAASGTCNAQIGIGDPYLPFLEILQMLAGDVETKWAGGAITREQAHRLWALLPDVVQALVDDGSELIDRFVPGTALLARAQATAHHQTDRLSDLLLRKAANSGLVILQQTDLFEQYAKVLHALARRHPLLLVVDDLQWVDAGSLGLLFHLGRRLAGQRILIVGAYRSEDIARGRDGDRHPLEPIVHEFVHDFGDIRVDLSQAQDLRFVETLLDAERYRLGDVFCETLYRHTGGHALFTVELIRGLQERGDLTRDETGQWVVAKALDWETLPPRVEAVIAERIGRLPEEWQTTLAVASVEGEVFTAEAVSRVQGVEEQEVTRRLSGALSKQHHLVNAIGFERLGPSGQRLSRYRFRHYLFQKYLYSRLDEVERAHLHEAMGNALEALCGEQASDISAQLARHFQAAMLADKAVGYLLQAGQRALKLSAHKEAIAYLQQGLTLIRNLPNTPERVRQELALQMSFSVSLLVTRDYAAPEVGQAFSRACELCRQVGDTHQLVVALRGLKAFHNARAELHTAREVGEQLLALAYQVEDPAVLLGAHFTLGTTLTHLGEFVLAHGHYEQAIAHYDPKQHQSLAFQYGHDPMVGCLCYSARTLWFLGYPDQALKQIRAVLALAQELGHPFSRAWALHYAAVVHSHHRDAQTVLERAEANITLATKYGFQLWLSGAVILRGWARVMQGGGEAWIASMHQGLADYRATGAQAGVPFFLSKLAEAYGQIGQVEAGLAAVDEALTMTARTGESMTDAHHYQLRGDFLLRLSEENQSQAEACFHQAIEIARRQQAKSWELQAVTSLCRLWRSQGKAEAARNLLRPTFEWFTEGFDTPDLRDARQLLEELGEQ